MPKFPKTFGRRKSTPNALEEFDTTPVAGSSFRVFERPVDGSKSFDGGIKITRLAGRVNSSPVSKDESLFEDLKGSRGSGVSNTNTASTTDDSSRFSAASTTPSSMDIQNQEEWRSPHDKPIKDLPALPRSSTSFSLKAAAHTFSFSRGKAPSRSPDEFYSSRHGMPQNNESQRQRNVTGSSYASTATPPRLDERDLGLNLGGDFADMFSGFGQRKSLILEAENDMSATPDDYSPSAPSRPLIANHSGQPSPLSIDLSREVEGAPYSWASHTSSDRFMSNSSQMYQSTDNRKENLPPSRPQRPGAVADSNVRRSAAFAVRRQSTLELGDQVDDDARLLRESANATRLLNSDAPLSSKPRDSWLLNPDSPRLLKPRDSWTQPLKDSYNLQPSTHSNRQFNSTATSPQMPMPKAAADEDNMFNRDNWDQPPKDSRPSQLATSTVRQVNNPGMNLQAVTPKASADEDNMFDHQMRAAASVAIKYSQSQWSPPKNRVMTPAQFEKYKQEHDGSTTIGRRSNSDDDNEEDIYDDAEDEAEKQKQIAKQRRKQLAHMAVYRQQMMKVTGEPTMSRPSLVLSQSTPNLLQDTSLGADEGDDEDEEVPLAILAAHGFPNKNKHPMHLSSMNSNPNLRAAASQMGAYPPPQSVTGETHAGGGGRLPVFARNLPQDPYIGAGLVRPSNRESLAFGSGAGPLPPPGGLVNVIVQEEISRAMRRGSPNNAGEYVPPPANGFTGLGMAPNGHMPYGMNGMGQMTQGDQAQVEMAQQMQQFMQMQMQFMQMMTAGQGPQQQNGPPLVRASTMGSVNSLPIQQNQHKRAMTSLDLNVAPWQQQQQHQYRNTMMGPLTQGAGYTPSIAPSERSNVGMPGRYRPVSHIQVDNSRPITMSGALQEWSENKADAQTIKAVKNSGNASDEDDEVGWEVMRQKREKKKTSWKMKRVSKNLEGLTNWD